MMSMTLLVKVFDTGEPYLVATNLFWDFSLPFQQEKPYTPL